MVTHGRSRSNSSSTLSSTVVSGVRSGASGPATAPPYASLRRRTPCRLRLPIMSTAPALLTDRYELTMVAAALADGAAERNCVFEVFARRLPHGRRYGVVPGPNPLLEALPPFPLGHRGLAALRAQGLTGQRLLDPPAAVT